MSPLIDGLYRQGEKIADTKAPHDVPIARRWEQRKFNAQLVNPANRRKLDIIVVGSGLAGGAAAASLGEQGYNVKCFFYQDSARRAHSIAAQGGINAAKNYRNDGDSVYRLFYDTVKGGDYRAREDNVYRLAEVSANIIDQCVAQGVPFAREYGGLLDNRSFGGVQVSRTFYARGQTGQQLLIGAYQALERQVAAGTVKEFRRHEMVELVVVDGRARGIIARDMVTGEIETHLADAVVLATGGYGNVFFLSTNAMGCNATAIWRAHCAQTAPWAGSSKMAWSTPSTACFTSSAYETTPPLTTADEPGIRVSAADTNPPVQDSAQPSVSPLSRASSIVRAAALSSASMLGAAILS